MSTTVAAALVVLLAGCDGAADATNDAEFVSCIQDSGLSLSGKEDWEQPEWADLFSQPEALTCAVDELDEDDRKEALQEAFPSYWEQSAPDTSFEARRDALGDYAAASTRDHGQEAALDGGLVLVESLAWFEGPDADGAILNMVVAVLHEQGELPEFDSFLQKNRSENESDVRATYGTELLNNKGRLNDRVRDLYYELIESFDASSLVP